MPRGQKVFFFLAAVAVLGGATFLFLHRPGRGILKRPQVAGVCSECGQKYPLTYDECPRCKYLHALQRASNPQQSGPTNVKTKLGIAFGFIAIGMLILNWGQLRRIMRARRNKRDQIFLPMVCQNCKRRLRFLSTSAGKTGLCPKCGGVCTFPTLETVNANMSGEAASTPDT